MAPDPAGGAYSAPPGPLAGFGALLLREGEGRVGKWGMGGEGRGREGRREKERTGEGKEGGGKEGGKGRTTAIPNF